MASENHPGNNPFDAPEGCGLNELVQSMKEIAEDRKSGNKKVY
jgi:hypothetical protein